MSSASVQSKYYSLALWGMVTILAVSNGLLAQVQSSAFESPR